MHDGIKKISPFSTRKNNFLRTFKGRGFYPFLKNSYEYVFYRPKLSKIVGYFD
jgi:hypothetical protein